MSTYIIVAVIAYLLGSIPFGYILVRLFRKQDVRTLGSGNIGATNVARSGAKGLGIVTLILDAAKGYIAVVAAGALFLHPAWIVVTSDWARSASSYTRAHTIYVVLALAALFAI